MRFPISTGGAARLLGLLEPQLNDLIRRGKISAPPPTLAGRRLWMLEDVLRAAGNRGIDIREVECRLDETGPRLGSSR